MFPRGEQSGTLQRYLRRGFTKNQEWTVSDVQAVLILELISLSYSYSDDSNPFMPPPSAQAHYLAHNSRPHHQAKAAHSFLATWSVVGMASTGIVVGTALVSLARAHDMRELDDWVSLTSHSGCCSSRSRSSCCSGTRWNCWRKNRNHANSSDCPAANVS